MLGRSSSFSTPASSVLLLTAAISAAYTVIMNLAFAYTVYILLPHGFTGEGITRCESKQAAATGPMKACTDALTWFSQVGLGLVQRQSRGLLGLPAGRQRGRSSSRRPSMRRRQSSSSRSRPPALRRRWPCPRTGATADDVFQALACMHAWTWSHGWMRREAAQMMPNKQACIRIRSSSGFFQGKRIITTIRN